jgi:glycosyltransferase involved in cell wall biosynthesis
MSHTVSAARPSQSDTVARDEPAPPPRSVRALRVLLVHERYPPDIRGGGEYVVQETARGLVRAGHAVDVLTTGAPAETPDGAVRVRRLPIHPYRLNLQATAIARAAAQADLIQTFTYHAALPAFLAARRLRKPVVCTVLGFFGTAWTELKGACLGALYERWERHLLRLPFDRMVFLSEFSRQAGMAIGIEGTRSAVINPGITLENYSSASVKDDYALFVGKLEARKGIRDVIEVARRLPHVRVKVVGWGPDEALVRTCGLPNLEFIAFKAGARLYECFARARLFIFPTRAETFGLAVAEAMASGCAVVSTLDLEFEGARVAPGNVDELVQAVRALWDSPATLRRMGARNAELAQRYSWRNHCDALCALYADMLRR